MRWIVFLKYRDCAVVASYVNAFEARIEGDYVSAFCLRKISDGLMSIEPENSHQVVFLTGKKREPVLDVKGHSMVATTFAYRILCNFLVGRRIDFGNDVFVLKVYIDTLGDRVISRIS